MITIQSNQSQFYVLYVNVHIRNYGPFRQALPHPTAGDKGVKIKHDDSPIVSAQVLIFS